MYSLWLLISIIYVTHAFSLIYVTPQEDLLVSMHNQLQHISEPIPSKSNALLTHIITNHSYAIASSTSDTLDAFLIKWNLPEDITALFQQSAYATTEQFQTFAFNAAPSYVFFEEYIGAAKRVEDVIALAYMHVKVWATPIIQTNQVSVRTCHKCWLVLTCCSSASVTVPRGFTADEITTMMTALRATAYNKFVAAFPVSTFLLYRQQLNLPEDF